MHVPSDLVCSADEPGLLHFDARRNEPCSIMHIVNPGMAGGIETVVSALADGHARAGHHVHVVSVADDGAARAFLGRFAGTGVRTASLGVPERAYGRERDAVRSLVHELRPEVVHTHGNRPDVVDSPAARDVGAATVTTVHGYTDSTLRTRLYGYVQRLHLRGFDAVVAVSAPLALRLSPHVESSRLHVIPNAFAPSANPFERAIARRRLGVSDDRFMIGWVGRMSREKGADVAVRAMARVASMSRLSPFDRTELSMIGDGPDRSSLERLARRLGVEGNVGWYGVRPDAAQLMAAFDVLLLSSRREGTPMVILEAMAAGTPIVATRVGGVPDVVTNSEALLVPPDNAQAMADAILRIMFEGEDARARAKRARRVLATRFNGDAWLDRYAALYRRVRVQSQARARC